jgi:hypothetical protein
VGRQAARAIAPPLSLFLQGIYRGHGSKSRKHGLLFLQGITGARASSPRAAAGRKMFHGMFHAI